MLVVPGRQRVKVVWARLAWVIGAVCLLAVDRAHACATCECGDPTLVVMGAEQPFARRFRLSLGLRHRTDAVGREGVDRLELSEQRLELGAAYAPVEWIMLSLSAPLLRRQLDFADLSRDGYVGLGDSELRARVFVFRDRELAPRHLIAAVVGMKLPTGPVKTLPSMTQNPELLAGTGSFDPLLGATYSFFADPWSLFVSEMLFVPTRGAHDMRAGLAWRGTYSGQYQGHEVLAARLSIETRWERRTTVNEQAVADTGGFIAHVAPGVVLSPVEDVVVQLVVHVPVINALYGNHDEGPIFELGAALDL